MKPIDALKAGTSNDADLLGLADKNRYAGKREAGGRRGCAGRSIAKHPADGTCVFCDERRKDLQERAGDEIRLDNIQSR